MVSSIDAKLGMMQSCCKCCKVTSCVLASMKWFTLLGAATSSTMIASSANSPMFNDSLRCAIAGIITKSLIMKLN